MKHLHQVRVTDETPALGESHILFNVPPSQATGEHVGLSSGNQLVSCVRELFLSIEELYEGGVVIGTPEKFFGLLEQSLDTLPVNRTESGHPARK